MSEAEAAFGEIRYQEIVADTAYWIDKYCTGGTEEDFSAARLIINGLYAAGCLRPDLLDTAIEALREIASSDMFSALDAESNVNRARSTLTNLKGGTNRWLSDRSG